MGSSSSKAKPTVSDATAATNDPLKQAYDRFMAEKSKDTLTYLQNQFKSKSQELEKHIGNLTKQIDESQKTIQKINRFNSEFENAWVVLENDTNPTERDIKLNTLTSSLYEFFNTKVSGGKSKSKPKSKKPRKPKKILYKSNKKPKCK